MIEFYDIENFKKGIILDLLSKSYKELIDEIPEQKDILLKNFQKEDDDAFTYPETIGAHVMFSCINQQTVGYFSWDNRLFPKGTIGQNCVLPEYRSMGIGKMQIKYMIDRFRNLQFKVIEVTTGSHTFFHPALKMYLNLGFKEIVDVCDDQSAKRLLHYQL